MARVLALSDWLLLAVVVLVVPVYSYLRRRGFEAAAVKDRRALYARSIATLWLLASVTVFAWWQHDRPLDALGFALHPGTVTTAAAVVCAMAFGSILVRLRRLASWAPEKSAAIRESLGRVALVVPRTKTELFWFFGVALSAGICEEVLYRGFFFAVASPFVTVYGAIAASAAIFGLGHAYQGLRGVLLTAAAGLFLGAFYFLSGSIVWPMILHVLIDVNGGVSGYLLFRERPAPAL